MGEVDRLSNDYDHNRRETVLRGDGRNRDGRIL